MTSNQAILVNHLFHFQFQLSYTPTWLAKSQAVVRFRLQLSFHLRNTEEIEL